jgi:hypothetical protein
MGDTKKINRAIPPNQLHLHHIEILVRNPQLDKGYDHAKQIPYQNKVDHDKIVQISQMTQSPQTPELLKKFADPNIINLICKLGDDVNLSQMTSDVMCIFRAEGITSKFKEIKDEFVIPGFDQIIVYGGFLEGSDHLVKTTNKNKEQGSMVQCLSNTLFGDRIIFHGFTIFQCITPDKTSKFFCVDYNSLNLNTNSTYEHKITQELLGIQIQKYNPSLFIEKKEYLYMQVMVGDSEEDIARLICALYGTYRFNVSNPDQVNSYDSKKNSTTFEVGELIDLNYDDNESEKQIDLEQQGLNIHQVSIKGLKPDLNSVQSFPKKTV